MYITMLVLSVIVFGAALLIYLRHPAASIFHPATFFLAFHGLVFVVRPWFGWYYNYDSLYKAIGFTPTAWDKVTVLICTNLGFVTFMSVALMVARDPLKFKQDAADLAQRKLLLLWFWPIAIPLAIAGIYATWWVINQRLSGEFLMVMDKYTGETRLVSSNGYFLGMGTIFGMVTVLIAYLGRFRLWSLMPFVGFVVLRFATGSRGVAVTASVILGLLYLFNQKKKWPLLKFVLPAAVILVVFNAVQLDRGLRVREAFGLDVRNDIYLNVDARKLQPLETMDIAMMEPFEFLVGVVPEKTGSYDYFVGNLQLFVAPIPRVLWKDKPIGAPIKLFELYRYGKPLGVTYSVAGMGWYYLGYVGVVIWSAFFAWLYAYPYRLFVRGRQSNVSVLAYVIFLSTAIVSFRDGVLYSVFTQSLFFFVPVGLLALVERFGGLPGAPAIRAGWFTTEVPGEKGPAMPATQRERRRAIAVAAANAGIRQSEAVPAMATARQRRLARMNGA